MATYEFLHSVLPNYTKEMYVGNEPKQLLPHVNGGLVEVYDDYPNNGRVFVYGDELIHGDYKLGTRTDCFICGDRMWIKHNSGVPEDFWVWDNVNRGEVYGEQYISEAKLRRLLNVKKDDSKAWRIFRKKMMELFEEASFKGEYRDL